MLIDFKGKFNKLFEEYPFFILDAGAREGLKQEWLALRPYLKMIGFEADPSEYERLAGQSAQNHEVRYIHTALFDSKTEIPIHVTKIEGLSSVYLPNEDFLKHFHASNTHGYEVKKTLQVPANKMDEVIFGEDRKKIDFIKVDVEGCAYPVLKGAAGIFEESVVLGVRVEAEFNPKYKGQHLASEVDSLLREHQFELFDIKTCYWKREAGLKTGGSPGQLVHGDFIYFLNLDRFLDRMENRPSQARKAGVIKFIVFCCLYGCYDLALEIVHEASRRNWLEPFQIRDLERILKASCHPLARIPKLKDGGILKKTLYHALMLCLGMWLERSSFVRPGVKL